MRLWVYFFRYVVQARVHGSMFVLERVSDTIHSLGFRDASEYYAWLDEEEEEDDPLTFRSKPGINRMWRRTLPCRLGYRAVGQGSSCTSTTGGEKTSALFIGERTWRIWRTRKGSKTEANKDEPGISSPVDANASLSYVVYDEYILNNNGEHGSAHVDDSISLHDYKKINKMEVEYDKDAREDGIRVFPGETEHVAAYQIVTDQCKKIAHTLLKGLRINELRFMCFSQFDESNVFVSPSGKVKFKNVHVISNLTPEELLEQQKQNYESAALVIEGLFVQNPPPDFEDLIKLIRTDFGARELYHIHAACVPMALFSAAFKDTYDHIRFALPKEDLRNILVTLPYVDTWKNELSTNDLLMVTFDYNPKSYQVPPSSDTQTCLNKFQKLAMKDLGLTPKAKQKKLEENEIQLIEALHFFDYLRNRTSHRMEPFQKLLQNDHPYTAEGSELVTYIRFPRILAYLQLELYRRKQHKNVPMDKYV